MLRDWKMNPDRDVYLVTRQVTAQDIRDLPYPFTQGPPDHGYDSAAVPRLVWVSNPMVRKHQRWLEVAVGDSERGLF